MQMLTFKTKVSQCRLYPHSDVETIRSSTPTYILQPFAYNSESPTVTILIPCSFIRPNLDSLGPSGNGRRRSHCNLDLEPVLSAWSVGTWSGSGCWCDWWLYNDSGTRRSIPNTHFSTVQLQDAQERTSVGTDNRQSHHSPENRCCTPRAVFCSSRLCSQWYSGRGRTLILVFFTVINIDRVFTDSPLGPSGTMCYILK